jgi:cardiolipin synthase
MTGTLAGLATRTPEKRILTVPNVISMVRLIFVPVFLWLLATDRIAIAGWLVGIVAWTDWIDGYLARRLDQVTELGKALDPVADRLMIASAVVGGLIVGVIPWFIGYPLIVREIVMGGVTVYLAAKRRARLEVRWLGKAATALVYSSVPAFYIAEAGQLEWFMWPVAWGFGVAGLVLYYVVMFSYFGDARRNLRAVKSQSDHEEAR